MPSACFVDMYKYIVLCLCVSLSDVLCDLNKEEGTACELDGVKGTCVKETECLTTMTSEPHIVCSKKGDVTIVCCTDYKLDNDTRNVVMSPTTGFYSKDGSKAKDNCFYYRDRLPYFFGCENCSKITKNFNEEKKCQKFSTWVIRSNPYTDFNTSEYPHQAMLGYGDDLASAKWLAGGAIVSDRFILTAAHVNSYATQVGDLKFIALYVEKRSDYPTDWQTHEVKRFIPHPDYKAPSRYHDIALIETVTWIQLDINVMPACLHVEQADADIAVTTTWRDPKSKSYIEMADTIQTIYLDKFTEEECKTAYNYRPNRTLKEGINYTTQMCYGSKSNSPEACKGLSGQPLLITTQDVRCVYTIIGVTSFGTSHCGPHTSTPDVYTRVAHYTPWIESVVWAE